MARAMRAAGEWNPNAILVMTRILVLTDSIRPLLSWCSIAASIPERCLLIFLPSLTNWGMRHLAAQASHLSSACRAASGWPLSWKMVRMPSLRR